MSFTDVLLAGMMIIVPAVSNLPENKTAAKECLAVNMYHEARDQGTAGRLAVSAVVLNRVRDRRFPNTVCEVVYQAQMKPSWKTGEPLPIRNRCQFSWYCDGKKDVIWANYEKTGQTIEGNARAWRDSIELAIYITGYGKMVIEDNTHGAVFYYNHNLVYPNWAPTKEYIGVAGNHTFMK